MISTFKDKKTLNTVLPLLQIVAVFGGLFAFIILTPPGTLALRWCTCIILFVMLFIGGVDHRWLLLGLVLFAASRFWLPHCFVDYQSCASLRRTTPPSTLRGATSNGSRTRVSTPLRRAISWEPVSLREK
jgi:cell division protein FtsW (lipid II flippase)